MAPVSPRRVEAFQAYDDQVLPPLREHGGRLERCLRNEFGTLELHIVSLSSDLAFQAYRSDPRRAAAAGLLETSSAELELVSLRDVP
jgi:hypothetical protein